MSETSRAEKNHNRQDHEKLCLEISEVVAEVAGRRAPNYEANLAAEGLDSMALLDVLAALEQRFDIVLNEKMIEEFYSISRIARVIQTVLTAVSAADGSPNAANEKGFP